MRIEVQGNGGSSDIARQSAENEERRQRQEKLSNELINNFLAPKDPETEAKTVECFRELLLNTFDVPTMGVKVIATHLDTPEEVAQARNAFRSLFNKPSGPLSPGHLAILIVRSGSASGEAKTQKETAAIFKISSGVVGAKEHRAKIALRGELSKPDSPIIPGLINVGIKSRWLAKTEIGKSFHKNPAASDANPTS